MTLSESTRAYLRKAADSAVLDQSSLESVWAELNRQMILAALEATNSNQCHAAKLLHVHRNTIGRNMGILGIVLAHRKPRAVAKANARSDAA